ncbi:MAG: DNA replication and repair protein RecF [Candidatus Saccharibacteria bacterium]|nr:DNA replication and repair protein RecF [Candidatus Saccharibacteria bacterium]
MIIKRVKLTNFRSHSEYILECKKKTSLILGENGSGKTSVLEAIYETLQGKSFRAVDSEILKRGADFYRVETEFYDGEKIITVFDGKKSYLVQDKKTARLPRAKKYPVILFQPDDLHIVSSSPTKKREFFDSMIKNIDAGFATKLARYNKALIQRNVMLKKIENGELSNDENVLFSLNMILAQNGVTIRKKRQEFLKIINSQITDIYRSIADNDDEIEIEYKVYKDEELDESQYLAKMTADFQRDLILGHTGYSVHRDSYEFLFNSKAADGSASRGETRTMVLALKFIEAKLVYEKTMKKPVVLLDDVFSELDEKRQAALVKNFKENQVIITSVDGVEL